MLWSLSILTLRQSRLVAGASVVEDQCRRESGGVFKTRRELARIQLGIPNSSLTVLEVQGVVEKRRFVQKSFLGGPPHSTAKPWGGGPHDFIDLGRNRPSRTSFRANVVFRGGPTCSGERIENSR